MEKITRIIASIEIDPNMLDINKSTPNDASIDRVLQIAFGLAGLIASLIIVIAGVLFILSRGDPQKSSTARNAIIYAAIGLVIAVSAYAIVGVVAGAL